MAIEGGYAPPGVYTSTTLETQNENIPNLRGRIPTIIGTGRQTVETTGVSLVRGSSATADQSIINEDVAGRVVSGQNPDGSYILADYDGVLNQVSVMHFPIVTGDGTGTTSTSPASIVATINGEAVVVLSVNGAEGLVTLAEAPKQGDEVRVSYFFNRTDTLVTNENLSSQVTPTQAELYGSKGSFVITATTNSFIVTCDGVVGVVTLAPATAAQRATSLQKVVANINDASIGTLTADIYTDSDGQDNLVLSADGDIVIGAGSANQALGLYEAQATSRNRVFTTAFGPIVDGTNSGAFANDPAQVSILVNGVRVTPVSVAGETRQITLASAPLVGSSVEVTYYHNTFRDQFDYLPASNVVSLDSVARTPSGGAPSRFIAGQDFVLHDDKIVWGTAVLSSVGGVQNGDVPFGLSQVTAALRDERLYMVETTRALSNTVPVRSLDNVFVLPSLPVDGTGKGIATTNPSLVTLHSGTTISEALGRPALTVSKISGLQVTTSTNVPKTHKVFATYHSSSIQDSYGTEAYLAQVASVGGSGVGTYTLSSPSRTLYGVKYEGKGVDLTEVAISFPSGSELNAGARIGSGSPVEENVVVTLANSPATSAQVVTGPEVFFPVASSSSALDLIIDNQAIAVDFAAPMGASRLGSLTHLVGSPLPYSVVSNNTNYGNTSVARTLTLKVDGVDLDPVTISGIGDDVDTWLTALNSESLTKPATYVAMSNFSDWEAINNTYKSFKFNYVGDQTGRSAVGSVTLTEGVYLTPEALATEVEARVADAVAALVVADATLAGLVLECSADTRGRLVFTLASAAAADTYGIIEFIADDETSFLSLAGVDFDTEFNTQAGLGTQTKFGYLPVAAKSHKVLENGEFEDRLILKGRMVLGNKYYPPVSLGVEVSSGVNISDAGFTSTSSAPASRSSVIDAPSIYLTLGWTEVDASILPSRTFYDGTGTEAANDVLVLDINGTSVSIPITSSETGTLLPITGLLSDINFALVNAGLIASAHIEGAGIRIVNNSSSISSYIRVGAGSANAPLGLQEGDMASSEGVSASAMVSALMSHAVAGNAYDTLLFTDNPSSIAGGGFYTEKAVSFVVIDPASGRGHVALESLSTGISSSIVVEGGDILRRGVGLNLSTSDSDAGEAATQGFFVTSDNPNGSGSANTSRLNDGFGQDGFVGQTYVDSVTGLTFTILPREGGVDYPVGQDATLSFKVSRTFTTDANVPTHALPGVSLIVSNTVGTQIGDTAKVETFRKEGSEPNLGQVYYVSYTQQRDLFNTRTFTNLADVIKTYGPISTQNSLSLGAYLAFANGAVSLACKQVPLALGQTEMTEDQVIAALSDLEGEITPGLSPSVITPLFPATSGVISALSNHCDVQSSLRYRSERRAVVGVAPGTQPRDVQALARATANSRVCIVYPDMAYVSYTDSVGSTQTQLVGGEYVAVALSLATSNPSIDAATPWTGRTINGLVGLARNLDEVDSNAVASSGVTVVSQQVDGIKVRHGLTTNMSSILTKTPTVVQIADYIQVSTRNQLARYIGIKFVPQTIQQIEGRLNGFFKQMVREQIISTYTGLSVTRDANDPTQLNVEVFYKPVYPLLYIQFNFTLQGG
jgi:hypothetical protein